MLKRALVVMGAALVVAGCQSNADLGGKDSPNATSMDNMFFADTAITNMTEIQEAQAALNQSQNPQVKHFAQTMIDDHTQAEHQLKDLAQSKGAMLPRTIDSTHMDMVNHLESLQGMAFDHQYIQDQLAGHKAAITETQHEADTGNDADVKSFAQQLLPTLQKHLQMAEHLQDDMNSKMNGGGNGM